MKFVFTLVIILSVITGYSQEKEKVNWYSFEEAVRLNEKNPKKILIDVYTDWCGWCKKMKTETLNHPMIAQYINKNFYPAQLNAETDQGIRFNGRTYINRQRGHRSAHDLAIALLQGRMSYPSIVYMDGKNKLITAVPGYFDPKSFEPILKYFARDAYKIKSYEQFMQDFKYTLVP